MYGTSAQGPTGAAGAAADRARAAVALAIAASAALTVHLGPDILDTSATSVRRCYSKVDNLRHAPSLGQRLGDHRPMALGCVVFETHQRDATMPSQSKQLIKRRLAFGRS